MSKGKPHGPISLLRSRLNHLIESAEATGIQVPRDEHGKPKGAFFAQDQPSGRHVRERMMDIIRVDSLLADAEFLAKLAGKSDPAVRKRVLFIVARLATLPALWETARPDGVGPVQGALAKGPGRPRDRDLDEAVALYVRGREERAAGSETFLASMKPGRLRDHLALWFAITPLALFKRLEREKRAGRIHVPIGTRPPKKAQQKKNPQKG